MTFRQIGWLWMMGSVAVSGCAAERPSSEQARATHRAQALTESDSNSCVEKCGQNAGSCWCDDACVKFGDCCADKVDVCGVAPALDPVQSLSCVGKCGGFSGSCWCDPACQTIGDCCADKIELCGDEPSSTVPVDGDASTKVPSEKETPAPEKVPSGAEASVLDTDSCAGICGAKTNVCSCADSCHEVGTCCADKVELCGDAPPVTSEDASLPKVPEEVVPFEPTGTCVGACGMKTIDCSCDDSCHAVGTCCTDKVEICGAGEPTNPTLDTSAEPSDDAAVEPASPSKNK